MKKKIMALCLAALMLVGVLAGCNGGGGSGNYVGADECGEYELVSIDGFDHQFKKYKNMTDEEITLRYFNFDSKKTTEELAKIFELIYPNIHVDVTFEDSATYNTTLSTLINNKQTPDVVMTTDADFALSNRIFLDIAKYFDSDDETANLAATINEAGIGCYGLEGHRYAVPMKFFPNAIGVDRNVLKKLSIAIPDQNWKWSEMIDIIKAGKQPDTIDGTRYFGCFTEQNRLDSLYGIAAGGDIIGEFGFDGKDFDLSAWAVGEQEGGNLRVNGYLAPDRDTLENEEWLGDPEAWCGFSGHVALFTESFWTYQNLWLLKDSEGKSNMDLYNLDIVPYVIPAVTEEDANKLHNTIATMDFGGVSSATKYPREAYELLKFMTFGIDGWYARIALYNDDTVVNDSGNPLRADFMPVPLTTDQGVWDAYLDMYCRDMDEEHREHWESFFASCMRPIPYGWVSIAGYHNACDEYFNKIGIHDIVDQGTGAAADYVDEATRQFNYYHATAMLEYFGPSGYNVLSEDEIAEYTAMQAANAVT